MFLELTSTPGVALASKSSDGAKIKHAFCGVGFDTESVCKLLGVSKLITAKQVHSASVWRLNSKDLAQCEADAIVSPRGAGEFAIAVRTADCVPIIFWSKGTVGVIHAGWRGLSSGVIEAALNEVSSHEPITALVGPSAGIDRYEVGMEVIEALGRDAVYRSGSQGKAFLDMASTAVSRVSRCFPNVKIFATGISTITDYRFHSFRREGAGGGRNLSAIVV